MLKQKALSFKTNTERAFSVKKKLAVLFIFVCMAVNGFVPSTLEISKYSLVMLTVKTAQNAVISLFQQCNAPLEAVANKVCNELREFLFGVSGQEASARSEAGKAPENTADNNAAVVEQITINESRQISAELKAGLYSTYIYIEKLFMVYHKIKIPDESSKAMIIVVFVMFIIGVRRRRTSSEDETELLIKRSIERTRISA